MIELSILLIAVIVVLSVVRRRPTKPADRRYGDLDSRGDSDSGQGYADSGYDSAPRRSGGWGWGIVILAVGGVLLLLATYQRARHAEVLEMQAVEKRHEAMEEDRRRDAAERDLRLRSGKSEAVERTQEIAVPESYPMPTGTPGGLDRRTRLPNSVTLVDDHREWKNLRPSLLFRSMTGDDSPAWVHNAAGSQFFRWSSEDTEFAYWQAGTNSELASYSAPSPSLEEALEDATRLLREKIAALLVIRLEDSDPSHDAQAILPLAYQLIDDSERRRRPVYAVDGKYSESSERRYGTVFRTAIRARLEPGAVDRLTADLKHEVDHGWLNEQERLEGVLWTGASVLVLAFAIFLLYTFLNAGTKGHFAIPLRVLSAAIFFLLCATVFYVRARLGESGREPGARGVRTTETVHGKRTSRNERRSVLDRRDPGRVIDRVQTARRPLRRATASVRESSAHGIGSRSGRRGAGDLPLARSGNREAGRCEVAPGVFVYHHAVSDR